MPDFGDDFETQTPQQNNNSTDSNNSNSSGGYGNGNSGGGKSGGYSDNKGYVKRTYPKAPKITGVYLPYILMLDKDTPPAMLDKAKTIVRTLRDDFVLRYTAPHRDSPQQIEVAKQAGDNSEYYLPWLGFNDAESPFTCTNGVVDLAGKLIPKFSDVPDNIKKIRAVPISMCGGVFLNSNARFMITWTKDGAENIGGFTKETGFNRDSIRIAQIYGIPVFNLCNPNAMDKLKATLAEYSKAEG